MKINKEAALEAELRDVRAAFQAAIEDAAALRAELETARGQLKSGARITQVAAQARAVAFEEAALLVGRSGYCCLPDLSDGMVRHSKGCTTEQIRALAKLDPALCVVERETLEALKAALRNAPTYHTTECTLTHNTSCNCWVKDRHVALALLACWPR